MKHGIKIEKVKKGRRTYGGIYQLPDGRKLYLAYRKVNEIFRSGEKDISTAVRKGTACWAIDDDTLLLMRVRRIPAIGVKVKETNDIYLTSLGAFYDRDKVKLMNYASRGGALQRYLPLRHFQLKPGKIRL